MKLNVSRVASLYLDKTQNKVSFDESDKHEVHDYYYKEFDPFVKAHEEEIKEPTVDLSEKYSEFNKKFEDEVEKALGLYSQYKSDLHEMSSYDDYKGYESLFENVKTLFDMLEQYASHSERGLKLFKLRDDKVYTELNKVLEDIWSPNHEITEAHLIHKK